MIGQQGVLLIRVNGKDFPLIEVLDCCGREVRGIHLVAHQVGNARHDFQSNDALSNDALDGQVRLILQLSREIV